MFSKHLVALMTGVGIVAVATTASAQSNRARSYNIAEGTLKSAIDEYARQSGRQVIYRTGQISGARSKGASGRMSDDSALDALLNNSGFAARRDPSGAIALVPEGNGQADANDARQASVADVEKGPVADDTATEIVVTAQFRSERLQDTPLAITALTGDLLNSRGQTNLADIGTSAPNVTIKRAPTSYGPAAVIFIRGIGQDDSSFALEPGVGVYVDDIYYSTVFGTTFDLVDLDRIEILRGPQGTLAGKNSIGGAVKLFSRAPNNDFGGFGEATVGSFSRIDLRGTINLPLVADRLALRVSGVQNDSDGYVTRYDYGCLYPSSGVPAVSSGGSCKLGKDGNRKSWGVRGTLRWTPSEAVDISLIGDYSEDHSSPAPQVLTYVEGRGRTFLNGTPLDSRFVTGGTYTSYATYRDPGSIVNGRALPASDFAPDPNSKLHDWGIALRALIDLSPDLKLTSITGYRGYDGLFATDGDGTSFNYSLAQQDLSHRQFSQEVRLSGSSLGQMLDWTVGGFFFDERNHSGGRIQLPVAFDTLVDDSISSRSYSTFAHATLHLAESLDLTGGIRYSDDRKAYVFGRTSSQQAAINGQRAVYSGSRFDYKMNLSYHIKPDVMGYAQFSTGYRAGGTNPRPFFANQVNAFNPETLDAYEIGLKSSFLNRQLTLNIAGFINKYNDILVSSSAPFYNPDLPVNNDPTSSLYNPISGTSPSFTIINGGRATLKGFEIEAVARPVRSMRVDASLSYLHFRYTDLNAVALGAGLTLDSVQPYAPSWKWSIGAENEFGLGRHGSLTPRVDVSFQDTYWTTPIPSEYSKIESYALVDARLSWASSNENWEVSAAVKNLFDTYYYLTKINTVISSGTATGQPGRPREWTLTLRKRF